MIISRWVENISDNMPTTASRIGFENRGDMVRAWNRIRRSDIKSNIHSPFINWTIGFLLLSVGVEGERVSCSWWTGMRESAALPPSLRDCAIAVCSSMLTSPSSNCHTG